MDSITQAALGAAIGEATLGKETGRKGALIGAVVATIPDLDVLLYPFLDELQRISVHRGYSHSILFSIIGTLGIAYLLSKIKWTKHIRFTKLVVFTWLALITHMLLDAFTSYGTQLFLPFSDHRVSFDSISIVDPLYTLPLMAGVIASLIYIRHPERRKWFNRAGIVISSIYLLFTLANKGYVKGIYKEQLAAKNISYNSLLTVPVSASNVIWYGVAKNEEGLYIGKYSEISPAKIDFDFFPTNEYLLEGLDEDLIDRLKWFAQDFYIVAESQGKIRLYNMQCDMQGVRMYGGYRAPTAFYFEINPKSNNDYELSVGMHQRNDIEN